MSKTRIFFLARLYRIATPSSNQDKNKLYSPKKKDKNKI